MCRSEALAKDTPRVSVLLPCRNGSRTLELALRSMLAQTFTDFELLLLDDGSTDNSMAVAAAFNDLRIRVFSDSMYRGLPWRLNQGVSCARGQYIARMDADDVSFPRRLDRQVAYLDRNPQIDLVGCRAVVFRDSGHVVGLLPFARDHATLCARPWRNIPLPHPTWMGRRGWFRTHAYRLPEVRFAEDQELLLRASPSSCYACLDDVLLGYRQGPFRSLLATQLRLFAGRGHWGHAIKAVPQSIAKTGIDFLAAVPGGEVLFFMRMSEPASAAVIGELYHCLNPDKAKFVSSQANQDLAAFAKKES
jgi:glycosyltransferase involved in cell wall biosynthesis